ncbi:Ribosome LSU-associated GTP-binding protein HflX [hydrothermal vent metagenome]|uniref:Ribosome LSU-associated GTP-binding protein HflX n=1 Tax=hydrothermal vent metagenome TaxID=652676 RepID=A0A3B0YDH6_9ZZZZ
MLDRPAEGGERAILVHLELNSEGEREHLSEFVELANSAGVVCAQIIEGSRHSPDSKLFAGRGKAEEIKQVVSANNADVVLFNHDLSPSQERNLETLFECRVLDRSGLILDIFAQRARSFEGQLQVELAQLKHLSTRLVRGWTHLERQKGGIGLRGPGETQLETDRRLIAKRMKLLKQRLTKVQEQRQLGRKSRTKASIPSVSLVGYTNAGKSTLFNCLTGADVYAADQLFATLDPTLRKLQSHSGAGDIVLGDTVGFIRHLPHDLVAAFRSTLEETRQADLLIHVVDAADSENEEYIAQVNNVLKEIDAQDVPQLMVYNKIDLTDTPAHADYDAEGNIIRLWVSAQQNLGLDLLKELIVEFFYGQTRRVWLKVPMSNGKTHARLHAMDIVCEEKLSSEGDSWDMLIELSQRYLDNIEQDDELQFELIGDYSEWLADQAQAS